MIDFLLVQSKPNSQLSQLLPYRISQTSRLAFVYSYLDNYLISMQHLQVLVTIPEREEVNGLLCLSDDKKHWIEIPSRGFGFEDFFIPLIYATDVKSGEIYSCIQCHIKNSDPGSITLYITELIINEHSPTAITPHYKSIHAEINGLAEWSGAKRAIFSLSIAKVEAKSLPEELFTYKVSEDTDLVIENWCQYYTDKQKISFETKSRVAVICSSPASRLQLFNYLLDFIRIQSLFVDQMPSFSKVALMDQDGEKKELQRSDIRTRDTSSMYSYVNFQPDIQPHFGKMIENYHANTSYWRKVFDLLNESRQNKTREVSFLNITTALEILHKYFLSAGNKELMKEYNKTLLNAGILDKPQKEWKNVTRYYHLIERTSHLRYFQQRITKKLNMCRLIRNTRNWYTHYDDLKGKVWTPAQLVPVNNLLIGLAKATILQSLGLPDDLINKLVSAESHLFNHNYEANSYSLSYREDSFGEEEDRQ